MSPTMQHDRSIHKVFAASATKGADGTNVFTFSTMDVDRDGDRIDPHGWDLSAYRLNPTVLWGHDHRSLPIGKCSDIRVVGGKLKGTITWPPPGCYPFADTVRGLVDNGFLRSASVGFRADASAPNAFGGHDIKAATLLEWSVVNIPSNPSATLERGIDHMKLKSWLGNTHCMEDEMQTEEKWLEVSNDFFATKADDDFDRMCQRMLAAYSEMEGHKFRQLMAAQLSVLGPNATISDLVRGIMRDGTTPPQASDVDLRQVGELIARVIATETANATKAALCQALGRLD